VKLLNRLPYSTEGTTETLQGEAVRIRAFQIIAWVSLGLEENVQWDPRTPRFPVVLDTGHNHNLSIARGQLLRWAGMRPELLDHIGSIRERGQRVPLHAATVWLHRNVPGERRVRPAEPFLLEVEEGIAVYTDDTAPRLPVLGLRALTLNKLHLAIDPEGRAVNLRTPDWRARLLRLLSRLI